MLPRLAKVAYLKVVTSPFISASLETRASWEPLLQLSLRSFPRIIRRCGDGFLKMALICVWRAWTASKGQKLVCSHPWKRNAARKSRTKPGAARSSQEQSGAARSAARSSQQQPSQEQPAAATSSQQQPEMALGAKMLIFYWLLYGNRDFAQKGIYISLVI